MLRAASSAVARTALRHSSRGAGVRSFAPSQTLTFHTSTRREEEKNAPAPTTAAPVTESKGGLFGTGLSEWYALPVGMAAAIPMIKFDWYVINEETQLAACFIAFCMVVYFQGGDMINAALQEKGNAILKEHRESEQEVIDAMEDLVQHLGNQLEIPEIMEDMNKLREEAYVKLNAAGGIKPKHDLKAQVERILGMIAQEEATVKEKTKIALMEEATASVSSDFENTKALKKAALDSAIATIKGTASKKGASDPVKAQFVKFFQDKAAAAEKSTDDSEEKAQRAAFLAKANAVAESEGYFFRFDDNGVPKMAV